MLSFLFIIFSPSKHIFSFSFTKDYNSLFHTFYSTESLCHLLLFLILFLVCVWVEVMFESDNTRKLKTEGGNMAQQCIAVSHPLSVLCLFSWNIKPTATTQTIRTEMHHPVCRIYPKNLVHVDSRHSAATLGQWAHGVAGRGLDVRRTGSRREKGVTRLQPRAVDLLVSAE